METTVREKDDARTAEAEGVRWTDVGVARGVPITVARAFDEATGPAVRSEARSPITQNPRAPAEARSRTLADAGRGKKPNDAGSTQEALVGPALGAIVDGGGGTLERTTAIVKEMHMWQVTAGFMAGTALGIGLPLVLLTARNLCLSRALTKRATTFFSFLASYSLALGGGALVALISGRLEPYMAAGSVFAGLMIVAGAYPNRAGQEERARTIRSYALRFMPPSC